jgi:outer membrane biosynthesis protein TonB
MSKVSILESQDTQRAQVTVMVSQEGITPIRKIFTGEFLLIGSLDQCHIKITSGYPLMAMIVLKDENFFLMDLTNPNHKNELHPLQLMKKVFHAGCEISLESSAIVSSPPPFVKETKSARKFQLIDGDECYYEFLNESPVTDLASSAYVDTEEKIFFPMEKKSLEPKQKVVISYYCLNQLVAMEVVPINQLESFFSKDHDLTLAAKLLGGISILVNNQSVNVQVGLQKHVLSKDSIDSFSVSDPVHKLTFTYLETHLDIKPVLFWRSKNFYVSIGRNFLLFLLPFLPLLFIKLPEQQEIKSETVVIYSNVIPEAPQVEISQDSKAGEVSSQNESKEQALATTTEPKEKIPKSAKKEAKPEAKINPAKNIQNKYTNLFSKESSLSSSTAKNSESSTTSDQSETGLGTFAKSSKGLSTVGGGKLGKLDSSGSLSGKEGFKNNGKYGKGEFDSGFTAAKTVVLGSMDPELLRKILREYIPQFRYCYQSELARNSSLSGTIDLNFTINPQGKVIKSNAVAKNGSFSTKGLSCIDNVLKMIPFPSPKGAGVVEVRQPLNFSSEKIKL